MTISFQKTAVFFLYLSIAFNVSYWAVAKYDVTTDFSSVGDARSYIKMSQGGWENPESPYCYRVLMPALVGVLNEHFHPQGFLSNYYEDVDKKMVQLNFGIINILFIGLTAFLLYLFCLRLAFSPTESVIAGFLYMTSFFVVTYYTLPMVDSMGTFFLMACYLAYLSDKPVWLAVAFLLGILTKETTFLIIPVIYLVDRKLFSRHIAACIPGIVAYIILRLLVHPVAGGSIFDILTQKEMFLASIAQGLREYNLYTLIENIQIFMFLWVLFIYAIFKCVLPNFLKRQLWLLILLAILPFLVNSASVGRVLFYLFPLVIPVALLGLREILSKQA